MNKDTSLFEEKIRQATRLPEPSPEFANGLWAQIAAFDHQKSNNPARPRLAFLAGLPAGPGRKLPHLHRFQAGIIVTLALLLAGIFLFATPAGRTLAQSILRFFTPNASNTLPVPTDMPLVWVEQTPGVPAATATPLPGPAFADECGNYYPSPRCTVEQVRSKVNFPVKELGVIPASMDFIGATGGPDGVFLVYDTQDYSSRLILDEQPWTGSSWQTHWNTGASAIVETVKIGSGTGEYVKGVFTYRAGETQAHWDANADSQVLRWVDNGVFFQMQNLGTQLERDAFIALAGGLTTEPVSGTPAPTPTPGESYDLREVYPLTVAEAEEKAGFKSAQPSKLPAFLLLLGASFEPEQNILSIFYLRTMTDGLLLKEQVIPSSGAYPLSSFIIGDKTEIEKYSPGIIVGAIENIQIGEITGQYVEGGWNGTDCCGWTWVADPYRKGLRWQTNGMAFELSYFGMGITQEDMLAVAKSLK